MKDERWEMIYERWSIKDERWEMKDKGQRSLMSNERYEMMMVRVRGNEDDGKWEMMVSDIVLRTKANVSCATMNGKVNEVNIVYVNIETFKIMRKEKCTDWEEYWEKDQQAYSISSGDAKQRNKRSRLNETSVFAWWAGCVIRDLRHLCKALGMF